MKKIDDRKTVLLKVLKSRGSMGIKEVIELLSISEATARRLFTLLQNEGKVIRTHGGIRCAKNNVFDYSFDDLEQYRGPEKELIGTFAATLVKDNDVIFLDSGTTVLRMSMRLSEIIKEGKINNLTVVTNSLANVGVLYSVCKVILIGGEYRYKRRDFAGYASEKLVRDFRFSQCFFGADGVDASDGFMTTDVDTARIGEIVIPRSEKATILADSEKFNRRSLVIFSAIPSIDRIITDKKLTDEYIKLLNKSGVELIML